MRRILWSWLLVVAVVVSPSVAVAQCGGGMMGGGHEHGDRTSSKRDRKTRETIDRLLNQERSRSMLLEAILGDAEFMRTLFGRVAAVPEWRALAAERLGAGSTATAGIDSTLGPPPSAAPQEAAVYSCPMHPEVVSNGPGKCPKCGMALERSEP